MNTSPPFRICWSILPQVSRSFAFVIRLLPRGLDDAVMVSYLLCRIADTIEDSRRPAADRRRMLAGFAASLEAGRPEIPEGGYPATYRDLMTHVDEVLTCHRSFAPEVRTAIAARVEEMCFGMSQWCDREIVTLEDQNTYCYYVAGLVGRLLTDLFHVYGKIDAGRKGELDEHAVKFGLALQKVNIIRDIRSDLEEGRCYWPSEILARYALVGKSLLRPENISRAIRAMDVLIEDLWDYLGTAVRYITLLPRTQMRVRMFCAIPLFMAVATVRKCRRNADVFLSSRPVKIPPVTVRSIFVRAVSLGSVNRYVRSWYRRWRDRIIHLTPPATREEPAAAEPQTYFVKEVSLAGSAGLDSEYKNP